MDIEEEIERWSPDVKAKLYREYQKIKDNPRRIFYCKRGRVCDGMPHEGVPYQHARADQWPPIGMDWLTWALVGGRGSGKTRAGAEYTRKQSERVERIALIGATSADVRDTMIEGDSGLIKVCEAAGTKCEYFPSKRRVVFANGARAGVFSGEEPDRLRGPQHGFAWLDEPAHYALIKEVWDMLLLGLRLGQDPRIAMTTTPLPTKWLKARLSDEKTRISRVSTYANLANLAPTFADQILSLYEGTRLGKQELYGEVLEDVEGALWQAQMLVETKFGPEDMDRIVVAIDPAGTANRRSDETGIVAVGVRGRGRDAHGFVLADRSGKYSPNGWAEAADKLYRDLRADAIVVEKNYGGDMVKTTMENTGTSARILVKTAMRSKALRAEPVVSLYEQKRVAHVAGLVSLEEEMLTWVPGEGDSPNRVDALVWGIDELIDTTPPARFGHADPARRIARSASAMAGGRPGRPGRALARRRF
jgi:phage terminase large subunit-like protein